MAQEYSSLYGGGTFGSSQKVELSYEVAKQPDTLYVYQVLNPSALLALGGPQNFKNTSQLELKRVKSLQVGGVRKYGSVNLGVLERGLYLAQLGKNKTAKAVLVLVTDLGLVVKYDGDDMLTYTADTRTGKPIPTRVFLLEKGKTLSEVGSSKAGLASLKTDKGGKENVYVAARAGDQWVFSSSYVSDWNREKSRIYLQTDRPVYRPGDTVLFKGTARAALGLAPLAGKKVVLTLKAPDDSELYSAELLTDAYGSYSSEFKLPLDVRLGGFSIVTELEGQSASGSFEVQEYVKPEYSVTVTPEKTVAVQGGKLSFTIKAEYLFGGGVAGGQVNYSVVKSRLWRSYWESDYSFYPDLSVPDNDESIVLRAEGQLNAKGELVVTVPLEKDKADDYQLTLQANVTDEARREVSSSASIRAYRSAVVMEVSSGRYSLPVGETATLEVSSADLQDKPVSTPFTLEVRREYWVRGFGQRSVKVMTLEGKTDAKGMAKVSYKPKEQGDFRFIVRAKDGAGNPTESSSYLWAYDGSPWYYDYQSATVNTDKPEYKVGDTATLTIDSPVENGYALITLEGVNLGKAEVVPIKGSTLTYKVKVTEAMRPNQSIGVTLVGKGQYYTDTATLTVPPKEKFLDFKISSDKAVYKPGETAVYTVKLTDSSGKPVQAQVSLGLVDEGVYLVREDSTPDIRGFFYAWRGNVVGTQTAGDYYFGEAAPAALEQMARAPMTNAVFAQGKGDAAAKLRSEFKDTASWTPSIETDANGVARIEIKLPDNLTTWRLTARAITLTDLVGQDTYKIKTTLPVIARLATPRFLVRTDSANLRVIGQSNLTAPAAFTLKLETDSLLKVDGASSSSKNVAPGARVSTDFTVKATQIGSSTLKASVLSKTNSDALERKIPIQPRGIGSEVGWAGQNSSKWTFNLPEKTALSSVKGKLFLTPSLVAAVSPALRYLAGYPYGCTEQTLSRFVPSLLARRVGGGLADLPEEVAANLDNYVQDGLKRLYAFQHDDGGWGFWENDDSSAFNSANVLSGLLEAKVAGYPVRNDALERGVKYLQSTVRGKKVVGNADAKAYAMYALARANYGVTGLSDVLLENDITPYGLALGALAYQSAGMKDKADAALERLIKNVVERQQGAYWESKAPDYAWNDDRVETTALALEALLKSDPNHPLIPKIVNWLLLQRKGDRWVSTKDTAAVVRAALLLSQVKAENSLNLTVKATLNGGEVASQKLEGQSKKGFEFDLSGFRVGQNVLELSVTGTGTLYSSANTQYVSEEDYLRSQSNGIRVARTYQSLKPVFDAKNKRYEYQKEAITGPVKSGDLVLVTLAVTPDKGKNLRYVLVGDPIPAGYSVLEDDSAIRIAGDKPRYGYEYYGWNYWYDGREIRDNRVEFYFSYLSKPVVYTYLMRAETGGQYTALPTQAFLMYEPEVRGVGTARRLEVSDTQK